MSFAKFWSSYTPIWVIIFRKRYFGQGQASEEPKRHGCAFKKMEGGVLRGDPQSFDPGPADIFFSIHFHF